MPGPPFQPDDLTDLAEELRQAGYNIGAQQYVAAHDLLIALAAHGRAPEDPRAWASLLAPIFCSTPAEQEAFPERYEQWLKRQPALQSWLDSPPDGSLHSEKLRERGRIKSRRFLVGAAVLLLIVTGGSLLRGKLQWPGKNKPAGTAQPSPTAQQEPKVGNGGSIGGGDPNFGSAQPLVSPPIPPRVRDWRESRWRRGALALLPVLAFLIWWWRDRRRRKLVVERLQAAGNPRMEKIVVRGAAERLFQGASFRRVIQEMRRHRSMPAQDLDVPATLRATLRRGRIFTPQYASRKALPEYLLLIDRAGAHDEQARLAEEIHQRLAAGGVFVDRYYFQHDPRICRSFDPKPASFTLGELASLHPDHVLLLFSDGAGLISPFTGEPEHWLEQFEHWPSRALLTPAPHRQWSHRETALAENALHVLSATEDGLASVLETIQAGIGSGPVAAGSREDHFPELIAQRPLRWIERQTPTPAIQDRLLAQLRVYLDTSNWLWLCACAVYPAIHWDLTLHLGEKLLGRREDFESRLLALVRLPWFRYGTMPDWLRDRLIDSLDDKAQARVRGLIESLLLTAAERPKEGMELEFARPRLRDLLRIGRERGPLRDAVFLRFMSGRKARKLDFDLPLLVRKILFPHGEPVLGLRPATLLVVALALSLGIWRLTTYTPRGDLRPFVYVTVMLDEYGREKKWQTLRDELVEDLGNNVFLEMVPIPGGEFEMGLTDDEVEAVWADTKRYIKEAPKRWYTSETPRHRVSIAPLFMGKFEVTQKQWRSIAGLPKVRIDLKPDPSGLKGEDLPVERINWEEVKEFIARLNARLGLNETNGYRLPSEAEWEYAARAGSKTQFAFGDTINPDIVNYDGEYPFGKAPKGLNRRTTIPVGSLGVANALGLFDMHGNVWEWCEDTYHDNYNGAPTDGRAWVDSGDGGSGRVGRGGGWYGYAVDCRSAIRGRWAPGGRGDALGFRLARVGRIP